MAHLYHVPPGTRLISGETVSLVDDEAHHAIKAGRLRVGERVLLGDGRGAIARAEALQTHKDSVDLMVLDVTVHSPTTPALWLVQSLAKSGRDEQAIEMATEVGVSVIVPLLAQRSVVKWEGGKRASGPERWQRIVKEATKQSLQPFVPEVREAVDLEGFLRSDFSGVVVALDHRGEALSEIDPSHWQQQRAIALVVGPEGGFSDDERAMLSDAGAVSARLGQGVLRASSAGPLGVGLMHHLLGHWATHTAPDSPLYT